MIRLKLGVSGGRFLVRRRAIPINPNAGELTTQNDLFLLTQDGRSIEVNQDIVENFQNITTQNDIQLSTQDGLEFITQDGRHLLTNVRD